MAQRGVRLDQAVAALNRLFEICIPFLIRDAPKRATPVLALARLQALAGLLIVSGYTGQWAAGQKTLGRDCALRAFFIDDNADDLNIIRRSEYFEDAFAVGHLRYSFR